MTRDEAQQKIYNVTGDGQVRLGILDVLEAVGLLTFDAPKSLPQKLRDFIGDSRLAQGDAMERLDALPQILAECGLKIVEK
jgi:hypothetical protein